MKLSIVILNYKTRGLLKQCLRGLEQLSFPFDREIIVVDNNSGDGSIEMMEEFFPDVIRIASAKNVGFAAGMNQGLKRAKGDFFLLLNTDIIILDDSIPRMVAYMEEHRDIGMMGPKLSNPDRSPQYSCMRFPKFYTPALRRTFLGKSSWSEKKLREYLMMDWDHNSIRNVDWVLGGAMLIRREAAEKVGPMDDNFFLYLEDTDYCRRFWENGLRVVYFPDTHIVHYHKRESALSPGVKGLMSYITRLHIKSFIKYLWKYRKKQEPIIQES